MTMKNIYFIEYQEGESYDKDKSQFKKIKFSDSDYLIYLGKDNEGNEIFKLYFKRSHSYLIRIFKNIIQEILNDKDIRFFYIMERNDPI